MEIEHNGIKLTLTKREATYLQNIIGKLNKTIIEEQLKLTNKHTSICDVLYDKLNQA